VGLQPVPCAVRFVCRRVVLLKNEFDRQSVISLINDNLVTIYKQSLSKRHFGVIGGNVISGF